MGNDKRFTHVYCVNCVHFDKLFECVEQGIEETPKPCSTCFPYDFENSVPHIERPHYEDSEIKPLW